MEQAPEHNRREQHGEHGGGDIQKRLFLFHGRFPPSETNSGSNLGAGSGAAPLRSHAGGMGNAI